MTQAWIAAVIATGVILSLDLLVTYLRKRVRRMTVPPEPFPEEEESHGSSDGELTV